MEKKIEIKLERPLEEIVKMLRDDQEFIKEKTREGKLHELSERFEMTKTGLKRKL